MDALPELVRGGPKDHREDPRESALAVLHREIKGCHLCVDRGLLPRACPILSEPTLAPVVLVGQAPGRVEETAGRPFSGRAGRQLFGWLARAGLGDEEEARRRVYITSITKCFPGPAAGGSGDRRPSRQEVELCRHHLDRQLELLRPRLLLPVGQLAIDRFLPRRPLGELVGRLFQESGAAVAEPQQLGAPGTCQLLPLPHPSGASRWLNAPEHRRQLEAALKLLAGLVRGW